MLSVTDVTRDRKIIYRLLIEIKAFSLCYSEKQCDVSFIQFRLFSVEKVMSHSRKHCRTQNFTIRVVLWRFKYRSLCKHVINTDVFSLSAVF